MTIGKMPVSTQISSNDFLNTLINITKTRHSDEVNNKIYYLLRKWAIRFEKQKDIIPNFSEKYESLKKQGIVFPETYDVTYHRFTGDIQDVIQSQPVIESSSIQTTGGYTNIYIDEMDESKYESTYKKFVRELKNTVDAIVLANVNIVNIGNY
jgi:hypothetical protein